VVKAVAEVKEVAEVKVGGLKIKARKIEVGETVVAVATKVAEE
jgi:hypothetical protein